jgi:hypothetical protein
MEIPDIRLQPIAGTNREELIGLNGDLVPDDRIIAAVNAHRRLFPHVVKHLALNQYRKDNPNYVHRADTPLSQDMLHIMSSVRDELLGGMVDPSEVVE